MSNNLNSSFNLNEKNSLILITILILITSSLIFYYTKYSLKKNNLKLEDKEILKKIYENSNGNNWDIKYKENWLNNECKLGDWAGIETGFSNGNEHVLELIMRGNRNFTGLFLFLFIQFVYF